MVFDWFGFLDSHHIDYKITGRTQVSVTCPFCSDDPSQHMSINIEGAGWRCWRHPDEHYGRHPIKLVAGLLNCSLEEAARISGAETSFTSVAIDSLRARVDAAFSPAAARKPQPPSLPDEFKPFTTNPTCRPYFNYLIQRGFRQRDILQLHNSGIYYCLRGPYHGRIIFTVTVNQTLTSWTGRTISRTDSLRYRTLSPNPETAEREGGTPALCSITDTVLWHDDLLRADADTIIMCEGPFDALKIRTLGKRNGITATCFFTARITPQQFNLLTTILPRFKHRRLLLDRNTSPLAIRIQMTQMQTVLGVKLLFMPAGIKDPGELQDRDQLNLLLER
jgi:hypothetical protein